MPDVRFDDGLAAIVPGSDWEMVASELVFTEGPVWHAEGYLLFSDIPASRIYMVRDGEMSVYREHTHQSNGLTSDLQGRLLACEHEARRVSIDDGSRVKTLVDRHEGKRLNSPNDIIVRSDGRIFFTDPPYGIREEQRELACNGVFTLSGDGTLTLLSGDFDRPNGLALSPDERTLYIADTARRHVRAFDVGADGALSGDRVFADMRDRGRPDGMKVDRDGRLFVCAGTVQVFAPDGRPLGVIECPQSPANCAWGEDGSAFYITARTAVYRTTLATTGIAPHLR